MLQPRQDFILIRPIERLHSSVIEVVSHEKHCRGEVLAVGPGKKNKKGQITPLDTRPGDIVAFGNGSFDFYPKHYEGNECLRLIQEADIAYVEEEEIA